MSESTPDASSSDSANTPAAKPVDPSRCTMTELVLPNDTNDLGNLMGGQLLHHMDLCAAIVAQRHSSYVCVTASVDSVEFKAPIHLGEVVIIEGFINRAFQTSMEVELRVWAENPREGTKRRCNTAYYTFVAVDEENHPVQVPPVRPETDLEKKRYEAAARRRELRLIMSGRLDLREASNLREYLEAAIQQD